MTKVHDGCYWLKNALTREGNLEIVKEAVRQLKEVDFDTIVFRGVSGALVAPIVASKMKKEIIVVRKGDVSHSTRTVEGHMTAERFIVLDDFMSTGETVAACIKEVRRFAHNAKFVGFYGYYNHNDECGFVPYQEPLSLKGNLKCVDEFLRSVPYGSRGLDGVWIDPDNADGLK